MFDTSVLNKFKDQKIMVCGDIIADIYEFGIIHRLSREAPIPIVEFESDRVVLGGAANVVANITSLQGQAIPVCILGQDEPGAKVLTNFSELGVYTSGVYQSGRFQTTTKRRIIAQGEQSVRQQILRLDRIPREPLKESELAELWNLYLKFLPEVKALILSDYLSDSRNPIVPDVFFTDLAKLAREEKKLVVVDSRHRILSFKNVTLLTPNRGEIEAAVGMELKTTAGLKTAGEQIQEKIEAELLLVTLGEQGMALFQPGQEMELIPAYNRQEVFDVSGAGDTVASAITLGLMAGMTPSNAAKFSNIAAGIKVRKLGTAPVALEEIINEVKINLSPYNNKPN